MNQTIKNQYLARIATLETALAKMLQRRRLMGWLRLATLVSAVADVVLLWPLGKALAVVTGILLVALFLRVVVLDLRLQQTIGHQRRLITINQQELAIDVHQYPKGEQGQSFAPVPHAYAEDLDLLGPASVFCWLHRTTSWHGHQQLAQWLLQPADPTEIAARQQAVLELAPEVGWRQDLQAYGMANPLTADTARKLEEWALRDDASFSSTFWQVIRYLLPAASMAIIIGFGLGYLSNGIFYTWLFLAFAFSGWISKKSTPSYELLNKIAPEAEGLAASIGHIENGGWKSGWLEQHQLQLNDRGQGSQKQISLLGRILSRFDYRYNPLVFIPLNMVLLWDLQQLLALRQWKKQNAHRIGQWLSILGKVEALGSLANLKHNQPDWAMPAFTQEAGVLQATALGHPLIPDSKRVCSDFSTQGKGQIGVITGSNMAGKSTFLRSVGLAIVLAHAGGPVCAAALRLGHCRLMSSMRIADNLEENTSTFYAELKKLKTIIEAVNHHEPVFLLLDEILRGTNSHDRQLGSKALVLQLIKQDAVGLIATHDLSLADMQQSFPQQISNYHFDVQVEGEELYFDYKLKTGVCTSLNASLLMKKIGIEL